MHTVVAFLVLLSGLVATVYYWHNLREAVKADMGVAYSRQVRTLGTITSARIQLYENFLRSSAGLTTIHTGLTQADWDKYHQPYEIRKKYPDIVSIGIDRYLTPAEVPAYFERRAAQGDSGFTIYPEGSRDVYAPVTFEARYNDNFASERGYDSYTDPARRTAMDRALRTGEPAMTGRLELASKSGRKHSAFILYLPVFTAGQPTTTFEERRAALRGFAYITVDMQRLLDAVVEAVPTAYIAVRVQDAATGAQAYQSDNFARFTAQEGAASRSSVSRLYGHDWRITMTASPQILSAREWQLPDQALWRGLLTCVFFAGLVWYLITDRERKYARQKQQEVQTAKDDLLSLASHQLRTPATVVKQYVGMLLQGYGGKLSPQQVGMLTNAYESNERQLEIINQLLYVARLDAGRIRLHPEKVDIVTLLRDVTRDQKEAIQQRRHKIAYKLPRRPLPVEVDPHYMRMVLENLLTNAIKYTPEGGVITLTITKHAKEVHIAVADNGVGISEEVQANVFEKFTRVENELSTDVNGSGVGLYLTQQIVHLHGGAITVTSVPGKGSTFTVQLPLDKRPVVKEVADE
jgi:signal transduction histidine kinase